MNDTSKGGARRNVVQVVSLRNQADASMRAIGMYFAEFSSLVALMRRMLTDQIAHDERSFKLLQLALGSLSPQQVADPFFAMCRAIGNLDQNSGEAKIASVLREQVNEEIKRRNRIAHGDWYMQGWAVVPDVPAEATATLALVKASDKHDPFKYDTLSATTIEEYAHEVQKLEYLVTECGLRCIRQQIYDPAWGAEMPALQDVLEIVGSAKAQRVRFRRGATQHLYQERTYSS